MSFRIRHHFTLIAPPPSIRSSMYLTTTSCVQLMREFIEREKRKQSERDAAKKEKSAEVQDTPESKIAADPEKTKEKAI
jgi:hypothetical protein